MAHKPPGTAGSNRSDETGRIPRPLRSVQRWHAVSIKPKGMSCDAAHACRAARFLSAEAPRLPLADCTTSDTCSCVYKHLPDRRVTSRREEDGGGLKRANKVGQERRSRRDRRKSDLE
jgi:hypothetical protein